MRGGSRTRVPHSVKRIIINTKREHPALTVKEIMALVRRNHPKEALPSETYAAAILHKAKMGGAYGRKFRNGSRTPPPEKMVPVTTLRAVERLAVDPEAAPTLAAEWARTPAERRSMRLELMAEMERHEQAIDAIVLKY